MTDAVPYFARTVHPAIGISRYRDHLQLARRLGFDVIRYDDVERHAKFLILRHDIDLDLHCAVEIGAVERDLGVGATYFVMLHNDLYNVASAASGQLLHQLRSMGHEIGLHFDPTFWQATSRQALCECVRREIDWLSEIIGVRVRYVSFHQPTPLLLDDDFSNEHFISVYDGRFTRDIRYIADSMGQWREESIDDLLLSGRCPKIQFLSHPALWCNEEHAVLQARLAQLVRTQADRLPARLAHAINDPRRDVRMFDPAL